MDQNALPALPDVLLPRLGFLIAVASQAVTNPVEAQLTQLGINSRQYGLLLILQASGPHTQAALGAIGRIDRTSMVALVDSLEAQGLLARRPHPTDRRAHLVTLTTAGEALLPRATALVEAAEHHALQALSPEQAAQLSTLLRLLLQGAPT